MLAWIRALHIRSRHIARINFLLSEHEERLHRLEIAHRQLRDQFDLIDLQQEKLTARIKGDRGGRPPKDGDPLAKIPHGDKRALRAVLLPQKAQE
jgi:hypothetical protein